MKLADLGVRLGFAAGTQVQSVDALRNEARWAAATGWDGFWVSQVFGVDPIVAIAAIAAEVPELPELGTSVVPLPGRHPLTLAQMARTAQSASNGRFTLGIGTAHKMVSEGFYGEPFDRPYSKTVEYLDALLPLLVGEPADVDGDQVFAKGWLTIEAEPVPVLLAALGPKMLELAARRTAGTSLGSCGPKMIRDHVVPALAATVRDGDAPRVMAMVGVCVTDDSDGAREHMRAGSAMYDQFPSYRRALDLEGVDGGADLLLAGSPEVIAEGLASYVEAGATDLRIAIFSRDEHERTATKKALAAMLR